MPPTDAPERDAPRRIALVSGPVDDAVTEARIAGVVRALEARGHRAIRAVLDTASGPALPDGALRLEGEAREACRALADRIDLAITAGADPALIEAQAGVRAGEVPAMHLSCGIAGAPGPVRDHADLQDEAVRAARRVEVALARRARAVLVPTAAQAGRLAEAGAPAGVLRVLRDGVLPRPWPLRDPAAPVLGLPGPHGERSGWQTALESLAELAGDRPALRLLVLCTAEEEATGIAEEIGTAAAGAGLADRVEIRVVEGAAARDAGLAEMTLALFPWRDGSATRLWPATPAMQALAVGTPVLMSDLGELAALAADMGSPAAATMPTPGRGQSVADRIGPLLEAPPRLVRADLAPIGWGARADTIRGEIARLDADLVLARTGGVPALAAAAGGDAAMLRAMAATLFLPERPGLGAGLLRAAADTLPPEDPQRARDLTGAIHAARKGGALDTLIAAALALGPVEEDSAAGRAAAVAHQETGELLALRARLERAAAVPRRPVPEDRPLRLAYVLHSALPQVSVGYATRSHGLSQALTGRPDLDLACLTRPGFPRDAAPFPEDPPEADRVDDVTYRHLPWPRRYETPDYLSAAIDPVRAALEEIAPDCVMAGSNHETALPALIAARELGLPFVYEVRGFWEISRMATDPAYAGSLHCARQVALESLVCRNADHLFTLTSEMVEELVHRGADPARIELLPNAVDPDRYLPRPRDAALAARAGLPEGVPVIGYVGSLNPYEGLEDLVAAAGLLRGRGHDFRLMIVGGDGAGARGATPVTDSVLAAVEAAGIGDILVMPGRIPHEDTPAWYSLIDIAPFPRRPSRVTATVSPLKPLEAMASGTAVVVSDLAPLRELAGEGEARGLVHDAGSVAGLADAIETLLRDEEARSRLGRAGRDWVLAERSWAGNAARVARRIDRLCRSART